MICNVCVNVREKEAYEFLRNPGGREAGAERRLGEGASELRAQPLERLRRLLWIFTTEGLPELAKLAKLGQNFAKFCKFLAGSFSAVSKRNFARKYAFDSIFQALQDLHTFAPLQSQNFRKNRFEKSAIFVKIQQKKLQMSQNLQILPNFKKFSLIIW